MATRIIFFFFRIIISITTQTAGVDFPGEAVDKNPPDNAGVGGSIPDPVSHDHGVSMLQQPKLSWSPRSAERDATAVSAATAETPTQHDGEGLLIARRESPHKTLKTQSHPSINKRINTGVGGNSRR